MTIKFIFKEEFIMREYDDFTKNCVWIFWTDESNEGVYHWRIKNDDGQFDYPLFKRAIDMSDGWIVTDESCNIIFEAGYHNICRNNYSYGEGCYSNIVGIWSPYCESGRLIDLITCKAIDVDASIIEHNQIDELSKAIDRLVNEEA
jgi:hypothetical protein